MLASDQVKPLLLESLAAAKEKWNFQIWAYVIMPEHVHVLIHPNEQIYDVSKILKAIKQPISQKLASKERKGKSLLRSDLKTSKPGKEAAFTFWQPGGGYDRNLYSAKAIWKSIQYIHMNPVKRGLVEQPTEYEWSSAQAYNGSEDVPLLIDKCDIWLV